MFKRCYYFVLLFSLFLLISSVQLTFVSAQTCIDNDGDGYGSPGNASCRKGAKTDCDDNDPKVYPGAPEICDGKDSNCDGWKPSTDVDNDGDGVPVCKNDCNDNDPTVYPKAPELCDGKDNNCDYVIPVNERDLDGDGYRSCGVPADCNDNDRFINPGTQEWCSDNKDNNCNGQIDEAGCICPDADSDGFTASYCGGTDCDDTNNTIYPGAPELCTDGKDNDCNGLKDCADPNAVNCPAITDADGDGFDIAGLCGTPDCDDNDPKVYPGAPEICDGKDSNCDGWKAKTDVDADGDGVPVCAGDCNDNNPNVNPYVLERHNGDPICSDGIDNDCDGRVDAADSDCAVPNCNTKTSPKDSPHFFTLLNADNTVHDQNNALSCGKCHAADFKDPIRFACQRCHADPADTSNPLNGTLKALYPQAPPYGYGTAPNVASHSSAVTGTRYGSWNMGDKGCVTCHNPHAQEQNNVFGTDYGMFIKEYVCFNNPVTGLNIQEFVEFTSPSGPGSFADGPRHNENICEMCHTQTRYHRRDGTSPGGQSHYNGQKCTDCHRHSSGFAHGSGGTGTNCGSCHGHDAGYEYAPGKFSEGRGTFQSHSTHTENDVDDRKGPFITCSVCHDTNKFPVFKDGQDLAGTSVCITCHSPGGSYDGVNDPVSGAKANWREGIYSGRVIKSGKELWCAGCHDNAPSNSLPDGTGVSAPNVAGNGTTFGFYVNGHGRSGQIDCVICHDASSRHLDHSYSRVIDVATNDFIVNPTEYRFYEGKRLQSLHGGDLQGDNFQLCYSCHDKSWYTDTVTPAPDLETNFRKDKYTLIYGGIFKNGNLHGYHIGISDCATCHDVHGTTFDSARSVVSSFTRMTTVWAGSFVNLTYDAAKGKYVELTDQSKWNDPLFNAGGASTSAAACSTCHGFADLANGVGPTETFNMYGGPWYLRTYKPHTYPIVFDIDNDGLTDNLDNCPDIPNIDQTDSDIDFVGDACDTCPNDPINDADHDGLCGNVDICPYDFFDDFDGDGVCGDADNCDAVPNPLQTDSDGDRVGDACDNCIYVPNPDQANSDGDMFGDACDTVCDGYIQLSINYASSMNGADVEMGPGGTVYVAAETGADIAGQVGLDDFVLIKYDAAGNMMWTRQFGTIERDWLGGGLHVDSAGNAYVVGSQRGSAAAQYKIIVFKFDPDGNQLWSVITPGFGLGVATDAAGNVYVTSQGGKYSMGVIKYDAGGNELWRKSVILPSYVYAFGLDVDGAGNVYAAGNRRVDRGASQFDSDIVVMKYSTDGIHLWTQELGSLSDDYGREIVVDAAGNSYVTGGTDGSFAYIKGNVGYEYITFKLDPSGDLLWKKQYRSKILSAYAEDLALDNAGNVYVTGGAEFGVAQGVDLLSYDNDGNPRFASFFDGPYKIWAHGITSDSAGNVFITGGSQELQSSPYGLFLMKAGGQCQ
ncbi:MAG: hypothetical protein C4581_00970 [Nitrospiraceae bacterium]|nr:MAG: hypothetical protein C4581_00970 [Nitrospiraceae bacterium]